MASTSPHPRCVPNVGDGDGGVGQRKMMGPSRNGSAKPFATLLGSSTITVMRDSGALPTTECTAAAIDSIWPATPLAHCSISAGKWMSNRAVEMVRQGIWGRVRYCPSTACGAPIRPMSRPKRDGRRVTGDGRERRGSLTTPAFTPVPRLPSDVVWITPVPRLPSPLSLIRHRLQLRHADGHRGVGSEQLGEIALAIGEATTERIGDAEMRAASLDRLCGG